MEFTPKKHKLTKTKKFIKTNNLIFIFNGINQNYQNWVISEQKMKALNINYYKVFNKITRKILKESLYRNIVPSINGITFFIKPNLSQKNLPKSSELSQLDSLLFVLVALKLNNKIYSAKQLNELSTTEYRGNSLLFYQFRSANLKLFLR